jgi:hypothetical protein
MASNFLARAATVIALLLQVASAPAAAQPSGRVGLQIPVQWNPDAGRQTNTGGDVSLDYGLASGRGRLFYDGDLDRFAGAVPWQTVLHNVGFIGSIPDGPTTFEIGASGFRRSNEGPWADAGFHGGSLVAMVARQLAPVTLTGSYGAYLRRFPDISALNQFEHYGSMRAQANLQSRTTIVGVVALGWKQYEGSVVEDAVLLRSESTGRGMSRHGAVIATVPVTGAVAAGGAGGPSVRTQWSCSARLAQSLDDRTGAWVEHEQRRNSGDLPPAVVWTPPLFFEDGVYDDPYVIGARTSRAGAKHAFARGDEVQLWAALSDRDFAGLEVPDLSGVVRKDTLLRAGIDAVIPLTSRDARVALDLSGGYGYVRNQSSDPLEQYTAHIVWLGTHVGF